MTNAKRFRALLHLLAGGVVVVTAIVADRIFLQAPGWGPLQSVALVIGLAIVTIGLAPRDLGALSRASTNLCLSLLSFFLAVALCEGIFRAIDHDFADLAQDWNKIPVFYRQPTVPIGDVYFRRPGPQEWTGQVLSTRVRLRGYLPNPYVDEPIVNIEYDSRGFRNPKHLSDWEIAVAGDSFTELGHLPYEQLFTSILAKTLEVSVLNLGASYTGPLTQLSYLEEYGIAENTRHALIVFFEGNDLKGLASEYNALRKWQKTGRRDLREFRKQPSFVRALRDLTAGKMRQLARGRASRRITAYFGSDQGKIPITLNYLPPGSGQLSSETRTQLRHLFQKYADFGRKNPQLALSMAYMPSKRRVVHDHIEFSVTASEELKRWRPSDLPAVIANLCDEYGIRFVDLTPALVSETALTRQLLYNSAHDTHLNPHGSSIVAQILARHFSR